jgi:hypothetical protein
VRDFSTMNETDVREEIVRPLISRLGYAHGTENNVRTEVALRYSYRILGHPKPGKDHKMSGFADYLCSVLSYARWTIEVKAPSVELGEKEWAQAHSYACHPEIAAIYFLLTNGREFKLYSMSHAREPILEWTHENQDEMWVNISNLLSPASIRARYQRDQSNFGKALAHGIGSRANVVGGMLEYAEYKFRDPGIGSAMAPFSGLRATVKGGVVERGEDGLIRAVLKLAGPTAQWDLANSQLGLDEFIFGSADAFISTDVHRPTIFQGLSEMQIPSGFTVEALPGQRFSLPFEVRTSTITEATGFLSGKTFSGVFAIEYMTEFPPNLAVPPSYGSFLSTGDFSITLD